MKYTVHLSSTVSCSIDVEADSFEEAMELVYEPDDMPGGITVGAFGPGAPVDESGDWQPTAVEDEAGALVWEEQL